jgi:UDP-N-acetylmuramate--alanine ligase
MNSVTQHVHIIGIGGSGLSAIARLLLESGYTVTGSDRARSPLAQELAEAGVRVDIGHSAENVRGADVVVRSSAISDDNVEVQAALAAGIPVLKRSEFLGPQFLGRLLQNRLWIAVAGTHGKTTTSAMIAWLLVRLGQDPSYIIGGTAKNLDGRNAHAGSGSAFVIEADEYDRMFLGLNPNGIVVTYLEHDHPDCYPTPEAYYDAFAEFVQRLQPGGTLLLAYDNPETRRLAANAPKDADILTYGTDPAASYTARSLAVNARGGYDYDAHWSTTADQPTFLAHVSLQVPGMHNVRNSLAALAAIHRLVLHGGATELLQQAARALGEFSGTGRRFDVQGEMDGITVIDDYAHHPTEIQATLEAARARYAGHRIWAVWQPHTYSRTRTLLDSFARSFDDADQVVVTEVYAAREKAQDFMVSNTVFSAAQVVEAMHHPGAHFIPTLEDSSAYLLQQLRTGDVLLVLSAGDADQVSQRVLAGLRERKGAHA